MQKTTFSTKNTSFNLATNPADFFPSSDEIERIQAWAKETIWKGKFIFGKTPKCPGLKPKSNKGFWLLVTHFRNMPAESIPHMVAAINRRSLECSERNGFTLGLHNHVSSLLNNLCWHPDKPVVLADEQVVEEWVWISFTESKMTAKEILDRLINSYPGGNEVFAALLFSDSLCRQIIGVNVIIPGYEVKTSLCGRGTEDCCLMIKPYSGNRKITNRVVLHPVRKLTAGLVAICSQY